MEYFELGELGHVNYISRVIHIYIHIELNYRTIFRVIQSYIHRLELHLIIPLKKNMAVLILRRVPKTGRERSRWPTSMGVERSRASKVPIGARPSWASVAAFTPDTIQKNNPLKEKLVIGYTMDIVYQLVYSMDIPLIYYRYTGNDEQ
jgi:hypothetical protein